MTPTTPMSASHALSLRLQPGRTARLAAAVAAALALGACGTLPPPATGTPAAPQAAMPAAWPSGPAYGPATATASAARAAELPWSGFILDARLRQVVAQALDGNRSLRKTLQDVAVARAQYGEQDAARLPTVGASVGASSARSSTGSDSAGRTLSLIHI